MMPMLAMLLMLVASPVMAKSLDIMPTKILRAHGKPVSLKLEIAKDEATRNYGLMNRTKLAPSDGMLFLFPKASPLKFWMKDTLIPLDVLFVDAGGRIAFIAHGMPHDLQPFGPDIPIATVIEIDGGRAARDGIKVGDEVDYDATLLQNQMVR
ncbi:MAG: DUF192 domain-containing protein [Rickettsiales bacterium]